MENKQSRYLTGRFLLGFLMIALGALILLDNLDIIYIDHVSRFWPAIFIAFGIVKLFESDDSLQRGKGIWWIFFGTWLLVSMNGVFGLDFHNSWPLLLIAVGLSSLWKGYYRQPQLNAAKEQHDGN